MQAFVAVVAVVAVVAGECSNLPTLNTIVKILINASPLVTRVTNFSVHVLLQYGGWNAQRTLQKARLMGMITRVKFRNS